MIPGSANPLLLKSAAAGGYQIERSLRFSSNDSGYLSRTPASAGNRKTWTWAGWVKRSDLTNQQTVWSAGSTGTNRSNVLFEGGGKIRFFNYAGSVDVDIVSTPVYRDASAWYHFVVSVDTTQATSTNRFKLYVNGDQVTVFSTATYPSLNQDLVFNSAIAHGIGRGEQSGGEYFSGYLADIHFIDGQALTPSSFTEVSATTGQLIPKTYSGSYGTNGFQLKFADNSSNTAATLGKDTSGNSNNWTPNNLSVTAGAGNDSLVDTPTSSGTDTGVGGEVVGNYCTWNPLQSSAATLANGNLDCTTAVGAGAQTRGTIAVSTGKWYWEILVNTTVVANNIGIIKTSEALAADRPGASAGGYNYVGFSGNKENNASASSYGATYGAGDVIGVALDLDAGTLVFYKNGTSQGTAFSSLSGEFIPAIGDGTGGSGMDITANFGQRPFAYTAPSGFKALCDTNLPAPVVAKPNTVMDVKLWTGDGASTRTISGFQFSPDFVWIKERPTNGWQHTLYDTIRGPGTSSVVTSLSTNDTRSEASGNDASHGYLSSFTSDGFGLTKGSQTAGDYVNHNTWTYVAWCWDAGTSTASNTQGSITSQVRANASAGFSVVSWSANNTANQSIGHGLGVTPAFIIHKNRTTAGNWNCWFTGFSNDEYINLNGTGAKASTGGGLWYQTPTSSLFYIGFTGSAINNSTDAIISYCFAPVAGYSAMGSYISTGTTDNVFNFCNFRPRFLLIKNASVNNNWFILDSARSTFNAADDGLGPSSSSAEDPNNSGYSVDFLSNGFKVRSNNGIVGNSGDSVIWVAFAESPFQYARAR